MEASPRREACPRMEAFPRREACPRMEACPRREACPRKEAWYQNRIDYIIVRCCPLTLAKTPYLDDMGREDD